MLIYNIHIFAYYCFSLYRRSQFMSIGSNIKKRRYELKMSQQELAEALGYKTRSTIAKIESGENDISHNKLIKMAAVLDTTVEALITGAPSAALLSNHDSISDNKQYKEKRNKTVAVILAGGKSSRNQQNIPNQFINILGKPVLVYCMETYQSHPLIDDIYIVCLRGWEQIVTTYAEQYDISKLRGLIPAASSGILSVKNGLDYIKGKYSGDDNILFQESTRPLITIDMVSKLLYAMNEHDAVTLCHSMKDYLLFNYSDGIAKSIDRESSVSVQSPEAYRFSKIRSVFDAAEEKRHILTETCCAMLMYNLDFDINFVESFSDNLKIVRQEDVGMVTSLLKSSQ